MTSSKPLYPVPRRTSAWGISLFLLSLGILFTATMVGYFWIRLTSAAATRIDTLRLPAILWLSTAVILASSFTISRALLAVRTERQDRFRRYLLFTLALATAFVVIQTPALAELLRDHSRQISQQTGVRLYGALFVLVFLHALHVVGGVVAMGIVTAGAFRRWYDHENFLSVRNLAIYWHFLDAVWLVMFLSLKLVG